jgi:hypothetical protein
MHRAREILFFILLIIFVQFLRSCESEPYKGLRQIESIWVRVDSIHTPSGIKSGVAFPVEFFGPAVNNACCKDCGYVGGATNKNEYLIKVYGNFDLQGKNCSGVMDCSLIWSFPEPGIYYLKIMQPDSSYLVKQINVN